jgi:CheY-like chemotaxis protein
MNMSDNSITILVAEDEDSSFMLLQMILIHNKFKVLRAVNGLEAVDLCRTREDIDLVLMDIKMPKMDGLSAARIIRDEKPGLPIVAVTAYALKGNRENALEAGCNDYLNKPVSIDLLLETIHKLIG